MDAPIKTEDNDAARDAFEEWLKSPPFERSVARFPEGSAWPGNYVEIDIDFAWCAWQDAADFWKGNKLMEMKKSALAQFRDCDGFDHNCVRCDEMADHDMDTKYIGEMGTCCVCAYHDCEDARSEREIHPKSAEIKQS